MTDIVFNLDKLQSAIIENTGKGRAYTRRSLSMVASGNRNPDLVRNLMSGKSRKPSYAAVTGLAAAMDMNVTDFSNSYPIEVVGFKEALKDTGTKVAEQHSGYGKDKIDYLDTSSTNLLELDVNRINLDLPQHMFAKLEMHAARRGVKLQALINMWLADKLHDAVKF